MSTLLSDYFFTGAFPIKVGWFSASLSGLDLSGSAHQIFTPTVARNCPDPPVTRPDSNRQEDACRHILSIDKQWWYVYRSKQRHRHRHRGIPVACLRHSPSFPRSLARAASARLWLHECERTFADRMADETDARLYHTRHPVGRCPPRPHFSGTCNH